MKAILKDGTEIIIEKMFENYYEKAGDEDNKRTISFDTSGETIDSLKGKLTEENLSSVNFVTEVEIDTRNNLRLITISKTTNDERSTVSVRLAV